MGPRMKTIWIISDGLPGHFNQSIGLSEAIQSRFKHEATTIDVRLKYKALRSLMRFIANYLPWLVGQETLSFFYQHSEIPSNKPDLIISAGGNTLFANIALSKAYQANNIFSGTIKGYNSHLLDKVFTVVPIKGIKNNVVLDLPPANIKPGSENQDKPFYTLLIGGDGAGYAYTDTDWKQLVMAITDIARRDNITWKITTSRRTGNSVEELLRQALEEAAVDGAVVDEAIWFSSNPQKVVKRFLEEGQIIFCSEDSLTMVSEAIYAHKPVVTLQPQIMKPEENDSMALEKYQHKQFIIRTPIASLSLQKFEKERFCKTYPDIQKQIADVVAALWS